MSLKNVKLYLKKWDRDNDVIEFSTSSATVVDAARALNCKEKLIAKTMSFIVDEKPILIVLAGDSKIDNHKYKNEFKTKAKMIPINMLNAMVGHEAGGVCPFAINDNVAVYLDESLKRFDYVYPACGSSNSAIKLTLTELKEYSNYVKWVNVSKLIN